MQYKMQFTVLDDAVKQNRKLPEIAFFDTDGNLIHLGGGDGGGDVDLSHLTELAFGESSQTALRLLTEEEANGFYTTPGTGLHLNRTLVIDDPDYNGIVAVNSDFWAIDGDYEQAAAEMWTDSAGGNFVAWAPDITHPGFYRRTAIHATHGLRRVSGLSTDELIRSVISNESQPHFLMDVGGRMAWGSGGEDPPDTALYRSGGFGAGYGHLSADAGGGFEVMSSAPEAEGSFVQIVPDAGYGGYLWIHNLSGHTDKDALYFDVEGEANPRFKAKMDGSLHWGDGTNAPDVMLERTNQGSVQLVGNGEWDYTDFVIGKYNNAGDHANLEMYADAEEAYLAVTYPAGSDLANEILSAHIYGEHARYRVRLDGSMDWGGGIAQPDTHLKRTAPGTLEIDHILSFRGDPSDPLSGATITWDQDEYGLTVEGLPGSGGTWFQVKNPDYAEAAYVSSGSIGVGGPYGGGVTASGGNRAARLLAESEGAGLRVISSVGIPDASEFPIVGTLCLPHIGGSNDYGWSVPFTIDFNGAMRWSDPTNYTADQDPFSHTTDVTLQRAAAGVLEIPQHGGGFKLTSPDGSQTKTVRLSNAGALELV